MATAFDELKIYAGDDIKITDKIIVTQPTLRQIKDFGEQEYFSAVKILTSVGADLKWQLWKIGIDYTQIEDYDLFVQILYRLLSNKNRNDENVNQQRQNPLKLILKDIDFSNFNACLVKKNNQIILYNEEQDITIDRSIYTQMVDLIRRIHGFKRNNIKPANERTKMDLIEDDRDAILASQNQEYKSILKPLISALTVRCGLCGNERIWNMKISQFFDNIKRAEKIQESDLLLQGGYSGFASLKGIDKERLNWIGDI